MEIINTLKDFIGNTLNIGTGKGTFGNYLANEMAELAKVVPSTEELLTIGMGDTVHIVARSPRQTFDFTVYMPILEAPDLSPKPTSTYMGSLGVVWNEPVIHAVYTSAITTVSIFTRDGYLDKLEMFEIGSLEANNIESFDIIKPGQPMKARRRQRRPQQTRQTRRKR